MSILRMPQALSGLPAPSSLDITALAPVPNIKPTPARSMKGGKIRFSEANAAAPM